MANPPLTRTADWIEAGYRAVGRGGLAAINVEAIANELGVSKAGFYHRFPDRQALVDAVLEHWSSCADEHFARQVDIADPDAQIRAVIKSFLTDERLRQADAWLLIHSSAEPGYAQRSALVRDQAKAFGKQQLLRLRFDEDEAEVRSYLLYTGYLGLIADLQAQAEPPTPEHCNRLADDLVDLITAPRRAEAGVDSQRGR